jgi:hypothetical protein
MTRAVATAIALASCCLAAAPLAGAAKPPTDLWATVNLCDTTGHPNMMGVRASMPGDAQHTKMYMRFVAQYYSETKQLWFDVPQFGVSKWFLVGSGDFARRQGGYTFGFDPPDPPKTPKTFVLRGAVDFKWTKGGHIVRTAHVSTKTGHPGTKGADPTTYSAGLCKIT